MQAEQLETLLVPAHAHTDDMMFQIDFDAEPFLRNATDDEIRALAICEWGGDEPADRVALQLEEQNADIERMLRYVREIHDPQSKKDQCGFEVIIDADAAVAWVRENRPGLLPNEDG